jgi:predicted nucleotidyltransferase
MVRTAIAAHGHGSWHDHVVSEPNDRREPTVDSDRLWALLREHRDEIIAAGRRHGATNIRVFGSVAAGAAGAASDIDVVADFEPGRSLFDLGGLAADLQDVLGVEVDVVSAAGVRRSPSDRARRILAEAVPV